MLFDPDTALHRRVREIALGHRAPDPAHAAEIRRLSADLGVPVIDVEIEIRHPTAATDVSVVWALVPTVGDADRAVTATRPDGTLVGVASLEDVEITRAHRRSRGALSTIIDRHVTSGHVTGMSTDSHWQAHVVWVDRREHLRALAADGVCDAIEAEFLAALRAHDDFGWAGPHWLRTEFQTEEDFPSALDYYR